MPAALKYVPPTDRERSQFSSTTLAERMYRKKRYETALKYYDGNHPDQLDVDYDSDEPDDNTTVNLVKITADRTASFLFSEMPQFEIDPQSIDETTEETWLRKLFEENGGLPFLIKLVLRGFLAGHAFVRVLPGRMRGRRKSKPQFLLLDPLAITVFWSADDIEEVLWYENRYLVGETAFIQDYVWRPEKGEAGEWEIYTYVAKSDRVRFEGDGSPIFNPDARVIKRDWLENTEGIAFEVVPLEDGSLFARHSSPISPIIEFGHLPHPDDRYGHGEVTQVGLQDTINRVWSEIGRIVRKHSEPTDVITGADIDDVDAGDDIMAVPNADARVSRLEMKGDLDAAVSTVERLIKTYLAIARVVLLQGEAKDLQRVTNASVRTLFIDALAKNQILRHSYGKGLVDMAKLAMSMSEESFKGRALDTEISIGWSEALPVDLTEVANINTIQVGIGARSKRTAATKVGDKWTFEKANMVAEREEAMEEQLEQADVQAQVNQKLGMPEPGKKPGEDRKSQIASDE